MQGHVTVGGYVADGFPKAEKRAINHTNPSQITRFGVLRSTRRLLTGEHAPLWQGSSNLHGRPLHGTDGGGGAGSGLVVRAYFSHLFAPPDVEVMCGNFIKKIPTFRIRNIVMAD